MNVDIQAELDTDVAPELIRRALLDFSERRLETWSKTLDPDTYQVHWIRDTSAEVTEGSARPKVWSRERYDWSRAGTITWTTQESNFCTRAATSPWRSPPSRMGGATWWFAGSDLRQA